MNPKSASKRGKMLEECLIVRCPCIHKVFGNNIMLQGIWSSESTPLPFLLCACAVSHEEIGTKNLESLLNFCSKLLFVLPSRFESIVVMAHSLKKNRWGSCRTRVWLQWTRSRHWHSSTQASCFGKEMPLVKGEIWKGSSGACCIQRHLDFAQTILVGVEDVFWIDWIIFAWICWWKKACAKD